MTPPNPSIVDIPDFLKKPQEKSITVVESILQETLHQEYKHGIKAGLMCGFLTGILVSLIIGAVLITLGIIQITSTSYLQNQLFVV